MKRILNILLAGLAVTVLAILEYSCTNMPRTTTESTDSVLNYPGAIVTSNSFVEGNYYIKVLYNSNGRYRYYNVSVSKYEFDLYQVGDTIKNTKSS